MPRFPLPGSIASTLVAVAVAALFACSDDASNADAAACTCPAAEAPLVGRVVHRSRIVEISASDGVRRGGGSNESPCLAGELLLSGACLLNELPTGEMMLYESGYVDNGIRCGWFSMSIQTHTGTATAICLLPPP